MVDRAIPSEPVVLLELVPSRDADDGDDCTMEHRLGTRVRTSLPVRVIRARIALAFGSMLNASLSGAYVETSTPLPLLARIDVVCGPVCADRAHCPGVPAYVTRVEPNGVGVEWLEFAPAMIRQLLLGESERFQKSKKTAAGVKSPKSQAGRSPGLVGMSSTGGQRLDGSQGAHRAVSAESQA